MAARTDDLSSLFAARDPGGDSAGVVIGGDGGGVGFHQGTVLTWNVTSGTNTVRVGGTVFTNLPVLTTSEATSLGAGDQVGIFRWASQYFILGRIAFPDQLNVEAASAGRGLLAHEFTASPSAGVTVSVHQPVGLSATVTSDPNRLIRISHYCSVISTSAGERCVVAIRDESGRGLPDGYSGPLTIPTGASFDPTLGLVYIQERGVTVESGPAASICPIVAIDDRGLGGTRTYQVTLQNFTVGGTATIDADPPGPSTLIVEDVGPIT